MARKVYRALGGHVFLVLLGIVGLAVGLLSVRAETYPTFSDDATLTMLDEATRTELLDRLRAQEEAQLPYGAWIYRVWNAGASRVPATFGSTRFTTGLATLSATPSYRELVDDTPEKWDPAQQVLLEQDENTVTLLGPEQFYAFDGQGRVCHEFVRYIAQPNGTILAQEIVKRVFDPADGSSELVIRETVGGETTSELRTSTESLDIGTVEGQWTPWAFGLSLDSTASAVETVSKGLESYDVLWQVGEAQSGRLVLRGEKDGVTARLVLDEMGTAMTKELTDWQTGLRFHQGSTLAASEMQWFAADANQGDTVVRVDEWFGFDAEGLRSKPKNSRKTQAAGPAGVPRAAVRACVVQTTKGTARAMHAYLADLFDMALGLDDAVYALPTTNATVILEATADNDSSSANLTTEESHALSSLADDLLFGLFPAAGGSCGGPVTLTVTRTGLGDVSASGSPYVIDWVLNIKTFMYASPPGDIELTATDSDYYSFDCWVDGLYIWTDNPLELTLSDDKDMYVHFTTCELTMHLNGTEGASESTEPSAEEGENIHCYKPDDPVTVKALPTDGWASWTCNHPNVSLTTNPASFNITQDCTVTAVMKPLYKITTEVYPSSEAGEVIVGPIHQKISGDKYFYEGTTATVRALPEIGYRFSEWTGSLDGITDNPASLLMDEDKEVTAVFEVALVSFAAAENQIYGFDGFTEPSKPWKSVAVNFTDTAQAVITNGSPPAIYFQPVTPENPPFPSASVLPEQASDTPQELTVTGHAVGAGGEIEATLNQGGQVVAEMGVAVYQPLKKPKTVALAHVSLDGQAIPGDDIEENALESYMNDDVFSQCVYEFDVADVGVYQIAYDSAENGGDEDGELDYKTPSEDDYIIGQLQVPLDEYDFVIVVVRAIAGTAGGFTQKGAKFIFVEVDATASCPVTMRHHSCAHEMGHACASLDDIEEKGIDDKNLMSYFSIYTILPYRFDSQLRKSQWDQFPR